MRLSREDGTFIGRQPTDGSGMAAPPQLMEIGGKEGILVQTSKGDVYAFTL